VLGKPVRLRVQWGLSVRGGGFGESGRVVLSGGRGSRKPFLEAFKGAMKWVGRDWMRQ